LKDVRTRSADGIVIVLFRFFFQPTLRVLEAIYQHVKSCQLPARNFNNAKLKHFSSSRYIETSSRAGWGACRGSRPLHWHDDPLIYAFILLTFCSQNLLSCKWITYSFGYLVCVQKFKVRVLTKKKKKRRK